MRLTKKISGFVPNNAQKYRNNENITHKQIIDKLGQLEDIMEKYDINSVEELERVIINEGVGEETFKEYVDVYVKPYKDIEEELGIDLVTLINALTCGIWLRNGNKLEHHKVFLCKSDGNFALGYGRNDKYGLQGRCLKTKKYKQHWALTKEELEK